MTERVAEGFEKLAQFEALAAPDDQIAQQFALRSRVLLGRLEGRYTPMEQITFADAGHPADCTPL